MKEELKKAIKILAESASDGSISADEALKLTQAALNAAHALITVKDIN